MWPWSPRACLCSVPVPSCRRAATIVAPPCQRDAVRRRRCDAVRHRRRAASATAMPRSPPRPCRRRVAMAEAMTIAVAVAVGIAVAEALAVAVMVAVPVAVPVPVAVAVALVEAFTVGLRP